MQIVTKIKEMQVLADEIRRQDKTIAFVPTMGYFHEGHLNLMKEARKHGDRVVVSIYVNPTQFGPTEDFEAYPRDFKRDEELAEEVGVDIIFYPTNEEMYPSGYHTYVNVEKVTDNLCGLSRPGHFRGVATICAKLFHAVKPHVAVFGKKDFQQLVMIRRMVEDLNMEIDIVGMPTTRESGGLAMSSRNVYLNEEERASALSLSGGIMRAKKMYEAGERRADIVRETIAGYILSHRYTTVDYVKMCNIETMEDAAVLDEKTVMALAVHVGKTRLIDNYVFGEPFEIE